MSTSSARLTSCALLFTATLLFVTGCGKAATNTNNNNSATTNQPSKTNVANVNSNTQRIVTGQVFVKSYGTPSESYGILLPDGEEIGTNTYDSMKEELRPYVGDSITVTFSSVCNPQYASCCRTVFSLCGFVKSWVPVEKK